MDDDQCDIRTFYYMAHCVECLSRISIPIRRSINDVPEEHRKSVLARLESGEKFYWPIPLAREEVRELMRGARCPHNQNHAVACGVVPQLKLLCRPLITYAWAIFLTFSLMFISWIGS